MTPLVSWTILDYWYKNGNINKTTLSVPVTAGLQPLNLGSCVDCSATVLPQLAKHMETGWLIKRVS
jgi:hypothetical protein